MNNRLRSGAAWLVVPAIAMATSLGVTLDVATTSPATAAAYYPLSSTNGGVVLSNGSFGGATKFYAAPGVSISGGSAGVYGPSGQIWTLANEGTISSSSGNGVQLVTGTVNNGSYHGTYVNSTALISGGANGVRINSAGSVNNFGTIHSTGTSSVAIAVYLLAGGDVTNGDASHSAATLASAGFYTVRINGGSGNIVTNYGTIRNGSTVSGAGVLLTGSGTVTNSGTASLITGYFDGVRINAQGTVLNSGKIRATSTNTTSSNGIYLRFGGLVTNGGTANANAFITGAAAGVFAGGGATTVANYGTIAGATGVKFSDAFGTQNNRLINGGTIIGTGGVAVQFGAGNDLLELLSGYKFTGGVNGGGGLNTVAFGGTSPGTFHGVLGGAFTSFTNYDVLSGATWTFTGGGAVASGDTLANNGTLINTGTLANAGRFGNYATLTNNGSLTNSGTLNNSGTINGGGLLSTSGFLSNSNLITNTSGNGVVATAGSIFNGGSIHGSSSGIYLPSSNTSTVSITSTGTITGGSANGDAGINAHYAASIYNKGASSYIGGHLGVALGTGNLTNQGRIVGAYRGVYGFNSIYVHNSGAGSYIFGADTGVYLHSGGNVVNEGTIAGGTGITAALYAGISNSGLIGGTAANGIYLKAGGYVTNNTGALISGYSYGVKIANAGGYVTNYGTIRNISTSGGGVLLTNGGQVTNYGGALISGYSFGVKISGGQGIVTNSGTIQATGITAAGVGILMASAGTITNNSGGTISGVIGIQATVGGVTVDNFGTIIGTGSTAVNLFGSGNMMKVESGSDIVGFVYGGGSSNDVLEFVSGSGDSNGFSGFSTVEVDSGASWTFANGGSIASGDTFENFGTATINSGSTLTDAGLLYNGTGGTFTNNGLISVTGTLNNAGTFLNNGTISDPGGEVIDSGLFTNNDAILANVTVTSGGTLDNASAGIINGQVLLSGSGSLTNSGTVTYSGDAVYGLSDGPHALTNAGTIISTGAIGVYLAAGGTVTNSGTGALISGYTYGVKINGAAGTVVNYGVIYGAIQELKHFSDNTSTGVYLQQGGTVINKASGSIYGYGYGVKIAGAAGTVVNLGTITSYEYAAVELTDGGSVSNSGTITSTKGPGIYLEAGGQITNNAGARISGYSYGIKVAGGAGTVTNYGTIQATTAYGTGIGVYLSKGGQVTNNSGALISGYSYGVKITNGTGTVTNYGTIQATATYGTAIGVYLGQGGQVTNNSGALISGYSYGVKIAGAAGYVTNYGTIRATGSGGIGVYLQQGGQVTNSGTNALISGYSYGVKIANGAGTVTNYGTIISTAGVAYSPGGIGVYLGQGGQVTNNSGALISGYNYGVKIAGAAGYVTNYGTIQATGTAGIGVYLQKGGQVINSSSTSLISGYSYGVKIANAPGIITNYGTIQATGAAGIGILMASTGTTTNYGIIRATGTAGVGISLAAGGSIINNAGGTISGAIGIQANADGVTVDNFGTIIGTGGTAVQLYGTGNRVKVEGGSYFGGAVYGGGGNDVLEFVSGSGDSNGFSGFSTVEVDSGASWTFTNGGSIASGDTFENFGTATLNSGTLTDAGLLYNGTGGTFTNNGLISVTGTLNNAGTFTNNGAILGQVLLSGSGSLYNSGTVTNSGTAVYGLSDGPHALTNAGTITATGTSSVGVYFAAGGQVTNHTGAQISGYSYGVKIAGAPGTVTNFGTIQATGTSGTTIGVYLKAGGSVYNGGTISASQQAVFLNDGGSVSNSGLIQGRSGVYIHNANGTVVNTGSIVGNGYAGVEFRLSNNSVLINGSPTHTSAYIGGYHVGVNGYNLLGTIINYGTIKSGGAFVGPHDPAGVFLYDNTLINKSSGTITSRMWGVYMPADGGGTLINTGSIYGYFSGVSTHDGPFTSVVRNGVSGSGAGVISGTVGMQAYGATVFNYGTIEGTLRGLSALAATITNAGLITGPTGILLEGSEHSTIINSGTILGQIDVNDAYFGVGSNTVINSGRIIGASGHDAVLFGAGNDRLVLQSGYSFTGVVDGGAGTNTLEFDAGNFSLSQLGSEFLNFEDLLIDPGSGISLGASSVIPSGLTVINDGSINNSGSLQVNGVLDNGTGTFVNSGTVVGANYGIGGGGDIINSGTIIGDGGAGVDMTAPGTLTNTGLIQGSTYGVIVGAGDTVINSGTIKDPGIAGADITSGGVVINQAGALITGTIGVDFTGTGGSLTNNGTITGTGGVAIQFDAGTNTASLGTGSVLNGSIDGGGGAGQINLTGTGAMTNTIANFGAGSSLTVVPGASWTASGSWTIASVSNAGTLQPGVAGTPLKLTGNFTQISTGVFQTVLTAGGGASELEVTGAASLAGTVLIVPPATLAATTKYTILNATGGVTGTFASVSGGTALLPATLSYDADDAFVTLTQQPVSLPIGATLTANQHAVAAGFDAGLGANPTGFAAALAGLDTLQTPALAAALDQLSGQNNADLSTTAILAGRQFINQFQDHALTDHGHALRGGVHPAQFERGFDLWGSGFGQSGYVEGDGNSHRLNEGITGGAMGAEFGLAPSLKLGAMFGYGEGHFDVAGGDGAGRTNYTEFAGTGDFVKGPLYITALLGDVEGRGTTLRNVSVPGIAANATAKPSDSEIIGAFEAGYGLSGTGINLTPFAGLNFGSVDQNAFTETGGGALSLASAARTTSSIQGQLGARISGDIPLGSSFLSADLKLAWGHEFSSTARLADLSFAGTAGTNFVVAGARVPGDAAVIGFGISAPIMSGGALYLHYDGEIASQAESNAVTAGLRFAW